MSNTFCFILIVFVVTSCQSSPNSEESSPNLNSDVAVDTVMNGYYEWFFEGTDVVEVSANYKDGELDGIERFYFENGRLKEEHHYEDGFMHGISRYYTSDGKIETEKELIKFYEQDTPYINTYKYFKEGKLQDDSSQYYYFTNEKRVFSLNENFKLGVKLNRLVYDDKLNAVTGDFDESFNLLGSKKRVWPTEEGVLNISIPTHMRGKHHLRFIVNDFTYVVSKDSSVKAYQYLIDYDYSVK